ncbi:pyruvate ferredoxin oxidoreductase [Candidatus Bathyarchaeota archaeon]|nr:MAG: pyruvate ferredoxin oxidoreductase [Candidatus Bathyarchaeota archaeon]
MVVSGRKARRITLKDVLARRDLLYSGHRACAGCVSLTVIRQALKAVERPTIAVSPTGCAEVTTSIIPYTSWGIPWIHSAFENAAATAAGIEAAFRAMKRMGQVKEIPDIIVFGGDGGTVDIGFQALSGAAERGHDFLYVLYDNEAYMNTGIQRSGATSKYAWTTTSPAGTVIPGKPQWRKPIALIMVEHRIPYVATASPSEPMDLINKIRRGLDAEGPAFIHVICPCPRGWRFDPSKGIEVARLAVQTCAFPLWEARWEDGQLEFKLTGTSLAIAKKPELKKPVEEYLRPQGRFRHLFEPEKREDLIADIQAGVDAEWAYLLKRAGLA